MNNSEGNFFQLPETLPSDYEFFQSIISNDSIKIERIISSGQSTPVGQWLEQDKDEWVMLLQGNAELVFEDGTKEILSSGDYILIDKNRKHRVEMTSTDPPCIWCAVHF